MRNLASLLVLFGLFAVHTSSQEMFGMMMPQMGSQYSPQLSQGPQYAPQGSQYAPQGSQYAPQGSQYGSSQAPQAYTMTQSQVAAIQQLIIEQLQLESGSYGYFCNPCYQGDILGAIVRLVFHDVIGGGGWFGQGGMNGCIDFSQAQNKGLEAPIAWLDPILQTVRATICPEISRADFWLLAANLAIQIGSTPAKDLPPGPPLPDAVPPPPPQPLVLPFYTGRIDQDYCEDVSPNFWFPSASFSFNSLQKLFIDRLGLTSQQQVALMGAHSLGRAYYANSGFNGGWTRWQSTFSNQYFIGLCGPAGGNPAGNGGDPNGGLPWEIVEGPSSPYWVNHIPIYEGPNDIIMLPVDIETIYSPNCPSFYTGNPNGAISAGCPLNPVTSPICYDYATNLELFFSQFASAWWSLTTWEYPEGYLVPVSY